MKSMVSDIKYLGDFISAFYIYHIIKLVETEEEKRKRLADAIQTRVKNDENDVQNNTVKHGIKREVESLKSKCAYCVAGNVMVFFVSDFN
jgi:hypothetical protein